MHAQAVVVPHQVHTGFLHILLEIQPRLLTNLVPLFCTVNFVIAEPFTWVMAWKNIIPFQHFVSLLEKHFFPKWMQVYIFYPLKILFRKLFRNLIASGNYILLAENSWAVHQPLLKYRRFYWKKIFLEKPYVY